MFRYFQRCFGRCSKSLHIDTLAICQFAIEKLSTGRILPFKVPAALLSSLHTKVWVSVMPLHVGAELSVR